MPFSPLIHFLRDSWLKTGVAAWAAKKEAVFDVAHVWGGGGWMGRAGSGPRPQGPHAGCLVRGIVICDADPSAQAVLFDSAGIWGSTDPAAKPATAARLNRASFGSVDSVWGPDKSNPVHRSQGSFVRPLGFCSQDVAKAEGYPVPRGSPHPSPASQHSSIFLASDPSPHDEFYLFL